MQEAPRKHKEIPMVHMAHIPQTGRLIAGVSPALGRAVAQGWQMWRAFPSPVLAARSCQSHELSKRQRSTCAPPTHVSKGLWSLGQVLAWSSPCSSEQQSALQRTFLIPLLPKQEYFPGRQYSFRRGCTRQHLCSSSLHKGRIWCKEPHFITGQTMS